MKDSADGDVSISGPGLVQHVLRPGWWTKSSCSCSRSSSAGANSLPQDVRMDLELLDERRFSNGVVHMRYRSDREPAIPVLARVIIDATATWSSAPRLPVAVAVLARYYAHAGYREFLWLSSPDAKHSRNVQVRPEIGIVIFDSTVPISTGQGVYMSARRLSCRRQITDRIEVISQRWSATVDWPFTASDVRAPS